MAKKKTKQSLYNYKEIAKILAIQYGMKQQDVIDILTSYFDIVRKVVLEGNEVSFPNIGILRHSHKNAKEAVERKNILPRFDKDVTWTYKAQPEHNVPIFRINQSLKEEMFERTAGEPYDE